MKQFATIFTQDAPFLIQFAIRGQHKLLEKHYWHHDREAALSNTDEALCRDDACYFKHYFKVAFRHMEDQVLGIRTARKALFESDKLGEHGIEIDLELERADKAFFFEVKESRPAFGG
jgi:hypothetical protein